MDFRTRHIERLAGRTVTWVTLAGLGLVLAAFAALAIDGTLHGWNAARDAGRSSHLVAAYLHVQDALSREESIEVTAAPAQRREFDRAARDFQAGIADLRRLGSDHDRRLAGRALSLHAQYVAAMHDLFSASSRGDAEAVERIDDDRVDPAKNALRPLINGTGPEYAALQLSQIDGLKRNEVQELRIRAVIVPSGLLLYGLLVAIFIAHRRRLDRLARAEVSMLDVAAHTDSLTGLLNRRALHRDLAELAGSARVVALLDVVGLKRVNDRDGHLAGDALLRAVATTLDTELAGRGRAYRLGGDEFAFVLSTDDVHDGDELLAAIRERFAIVHRDGIRGGLAHGAGDPSATLSSASAALVAARRAEAPARVAA